MFLIEAPNLHGLRYTKNNLLNKSLVKCSTDNILDEIEKRNHYANHSYHI